MNSVPPSSTPAKPLNTKRRWPAKPVVGICAALLLAFGIGILVLKSLSNDYAPNDPLNPRFVHLRKGTFYMGGSGGKAGTPTDIKEDFEIAVYTVTQGQWQALIGNNPSHFSRMGDEHLVDDISDADLAQFPVENVSWDMVQAFIKKVNAREEGRGWWYRLPREAEWEYACRQGATSEKECSYDFYIDMPTNDASSCQANFNGDSPAGKGQKGPYLKRPTKVGSYQPNNLGIFDMHGNVCQWCEDLHERGPDRVIRGGCWCLEGQYCRAADRSGGVPSLRSGDLGFRLARVSTR